MTLVSSTSFWYSLNPIFNMDILLSSYIVDCAANQMRQYMENIFENVKILYVSVQLEYGIML